jgi:hypothetical protein
MPAPTMIRRACLSTVYAPRLTCVAVQTPTEDEKMQRPLRHAAFVENLFHLIVERADLLSHQPFCAHSILCKNQL